MASFHWLFVLSTKLSTSIECALSTQWINVGFIKLNSRDTHRFNSQIKGITKATINPERHGLWQKLLPVH